MQQVEQLAEAARRVAEALLRREREELIEVEREADGMLAEFEHDRVALLDSRSTAQLLRPPRRISHYARVLAHKAALAEALGRPEEAMQLARRALELQLEAAALEEVFSRVDRQAITDLLDHEPPPPLSERYRELLDQLAARA